MHYCILSSVCGNIWCAHCYCVVGVFLFCFICCYVHHTERNFKILCTKLFLYRVLCRILYLTVTIRIEIETFPTYTLHQLHSTSSAMYSHHRMVYQATLVAMTDGRRGAKLTAAAIHGGLWSVEAYFSQRYPEKRTVHSRY